MVSTEFTGSGRKKSKISSDAAEGRLTEGVLEFVMACDAAKTKKGRSLLLSEIYQVMISLGYRKDGMDYCVICDKCGRSLGYTDPICRKRGKTYCKECVR